jgi:hypothetical protein
VAANLQSSPFVASKSRRASVDVYLECGTKRVFACALDWPGWCRSGKTEELALEALAAYVGRYAIVAAEAGVPFNASAGPDFQVRERLQGNATTEFGAPAIPATADLDPLTNKQAGLLATILRASWSVLDRVVATAPAALRKGPRGGGRDRDAVVEHVVAAEYAYARKLGLRGIRQPFAGDPAAVESMREAISDALIRPPEAAQASAWPPRYAARRLTWHVLDHAWEIEDRSISD